MKDIADVQKRAKTAYRRNIRAWLAGDFNPVSIALNVPKAREVEHDQGAEMREWIAEWEQAPISDPVEWEERRIGYVGTYRVPVRVVLDSPDLVAKVSGIEHHWQRVSQLRDYFVQELGEATLPPLLTQFGRWREWDDDTVRRFAAVINWLRAHEVSEFYLRQVPVEGVDKKWVSDHIEVITAVMGDVTFRQPPRLVEFRSLDPVVKIRNVEHLALRIDDAAKVDPAFDRALIVEDQETFLSLPQVPGTVAFWGGGYRVDEISDSLPWLQRREVWYWGELSVAGYQTLDRLRDRLPVVKSVLMDPDTVRKHRHLAVEKQEIEFIPEHLTTLEEEAMWLLAGRVVRQDQVVFDHAVDQLRQVGKS